MPENSKDLRSHCPINFILETLGDKWTLLIVRDLMFHQKCYYGDFAKSDEKISTNILADRLQRLETNGIVVKEVDDKNLSKWRYSLTVKGKDLMPMMLEISAWSRKYDSFSNAPAIFGEGFRDSQKEILASLQQD